MRVAALGLLALVADGNLQTRLEEVSSTSVALQFAQGQALTIPLSGWNIGGIVNILDGQDIALSFELMQAGQLKYISRSSIIGGSPGFPETWGGWPLGPISKTTTLVFTLAEIGTQAKPRAKLALTVDGMQFPWFDFELPEGNAGPFSGYELVNLPTASAPTVASRVCSIACNVEECAINALDQNVKQLSPSEGKSGFCNSVFGTTGGECCTGTKSTFTSNSIQAGSIASIVPIGPETTYLDRACASVEVTETCSDFVKQRDNQLPFNKKVFVTEILKDAAQIPTGRVVVYLPMSNAKLIASPWMLVPVMAVTGTQVVTGAPAIKIDQGTGQVTSNQLNADMSFRFVTRLQQGANLFQFTPARWQTLASSGNQYTMIYSDAPRLIPEDETTCTSVAMWTDGQVNQRNCNNYATGEGMGPWCTKFGLATNAWKQEVCSGANCPISGFANNGLSALDACCACGGGTPVAGTA